MKYFLGVDFLLETNTAKRLYYDYAKDLPIIDYHCHLSPQLISENKNFENTTLAWLEGDHYKWRAMRILGIEEKYITGSASDRMKFKKWAATVPYTMRNALYHWTHMELKSSFGVKTLFSERNAEKVYEICNEALQQDALRPQQMLRGFDGTTDDPLDNLTFHEYLADSSFQTEVLPSFRPDSVLQVDQQDDFRQYIQKLSSITAINIVDIDSLLEALQNRVDYFHERGCRLSDHSLDALPFPKPMSAQLDRVFKRVIAGDDSQAEPYKDQFEGYMLGELCRIYHTKGWVQQFHLGPQRNNNTRMFQQKGPNIGFDSIGDYRQSQSMASFFDSLDKDDQLAKTIIYNLNPSDNASFAAMTGSFTGENIKGKLQFGAAWWFLDQLDGMEE